MWTVEHLVVLNRVLDAGMLTCPFYGKRCLLWPHQHRIADWTFPIPLFCVRVSVEVRGQLFTALVFETGSFPEPGALQCSEVGRPVSSRDQPVCSPAAVVTGMYQSHT